MRLVETKRRRHPQFNSGSESRIGTPFGWTGRRLPFTARARFHVHQGERLRTSADQGPRGGWFCTPTTRHAADSYLVMAKSVKTFERLTTALQRLCKQRRPRGKR